MAIQGNKIMNLEDGQVLYNDLRRRIEKNAGVIEEVINTPSAVQTFDDGADGLPMALTIGIEPVQDLHGYENPWPAGGGKNLLENTGTSQTVNGITYTVNSDGSVAANGTATANGSFIIHPSSAFLSAGSYKLNGNANFSAGIVLQVYSYTQSVNIARCTSNNDADFSIQENEEISVVLYVFSGQTLTNFKFYPMIRLSTESDPTYAPYSNICPISGWTGAKVSRTGFNVWDGVYESGRYLTKDNSILNSSAYGVTDYIPVVPNKDYYFRTYGISSSLTGACWYDINKNLISGFGFSASPNDDAGIHTSPANARYLRFTIWLNDVNNICINFSDTSKNGQSEPYSGTTYSITFPSSAGTVYGGTLTVNQDGSGELVVDRKTIIFDGVTSGQCVTNVGSRASSDPYNFYLILNDGYLFGGTARWLANAEMLEKGFVYSHGPIEAAPSQSYRLAAYVGGGGTVLQPRMFIPLDEGIDTVAKCNEWLAEQYTNGTPVQYIYPLATPVTYPLTPGQVNTLLGVNNLFADCGSITEVRYAADTKLYIDKKFAELQALILENISNT